ncbi:hypothetical protein [Bifidobacterium longum]|uniref:Uncharacterized protein n=1 Tax=Bifidobacterium longum TaxID=216816 RepID=A0A6N2SNX7_BIFLN|nr:hypothetical protein [Bifidobacterium longum]MDW3127304.1 hypothetical protein [Bifidobacterium longum]
MFETERREKENREAEQRKLDAERDAAWRTEQAEKREKNQMNQKKPVDYDDYRDSRYPDDDEFGAFVYLPVESGGWNEHAHYDDNGNPYLDDDWDKLPH